MLSLYFINDLMLENYKGWEITLNWDEYSLDFKIPDKKHSLEQKIRWEGVNFKGKKVYGSSLKEIRHLIDYPGLHK